MVQFFRNFSAIVTRALVIAVTVAILSACSEKQCPEAPPLAASAPATSIASGSAQDGDDRAGREHDSTPPPEVQNRCAVSNGEVHIFAAAVMRWSNVLPITCERGKLTKSRGHEQAPSDRRALATIGSERAGRRRYGVMVGDAAVVSRSRPPFASYASRRAPSGALRPLAAGSCRRRLLRSPSGATAGRRA